MTPELEAKIADVLARMSLLAEGSTTNFDAHTSHGASESHIPPGVNLDGQPPRRDEDSPYLYWSWRFGQAIMREEDDFRVHRLYLSAERDYWAAKYYSENRVARRSGDLTDNDIRDGGAAEREAGRRIVEEYEGVPAIEVAYLYEDVSEEWVKKVRRQHKRNPHDGKPRSEFLELDEEGRHRKAAELQAKGMGPKVAADKLRVAKSTLQRYWPAETAKMEAA